MSQKEQGADRERVFCKSWGGRGRGRFLKSLEERDLLREKKEN